MVRAMASALLSCALMLASSSCSAETQQRPNILLILADDLGYADVGFNGSPDIKTPKLDRLAAAGMVFSSAYVVHPFCGPSRMGLLSGRYPYEYGAPFNLPPHSSGDYREHGISPSETMISTVLQNAGYHTGIMGKWHLGQQPQYHPNNRGFDEFYGFQGGGILYFGPYEANNEAGTVWDYKVYPEHNGVADTSLTEADYMTDVLTAKGVDFINRAAARENPFFLYMAYNAPHTVLAAKEEDKALYPNLQGKRKIYAGMVHALDRGVGELVEALQARGLYENTLIVFLSDNGGRTDQGANNSPLQGVKGDTYEGGYRTPMFFHWPGKVKAGQTYEHPVSALDFYPTFARLAEASIPADKDLDGKDIWADVLAGRNPRAGEIFYTLRHRNNQTDFGARQDQWKIVRADGKWQLFNLDEDIGEQHDLSKKHPERLREMVAALEKMTRNHPQPLWWDSSEAESQWHKSGMPNRRKMFSIK
ncbi:MAG: sulfatase-like hydrolase/transferase [Gammaproteobacteria bacterium]|nr:sulfatase-like hydrolase/transferase [Gammaproteobacteria bacterium]